MNLFRFAYCIIVLAHLAASQPPSPQPPNQSAADLAGALGQLSLDPAATYRVRELQLTRGDIKIYLTEGVLSFVTPVSGRRIAAVFTTQGAEAGDAELLVLPPQRSERASLAAFTKTPNLDEHFDSAVLFFSDNTAHELMTQIEQREVRKAPEIVAQLAPAFEPVVRQVAALIEVRLAQSFFDTHPPETGFFYSAVAGRTLGAFDLVYEPGEFEPVLLGRPAVTEGQQHFQLWTSFRPRHAPPYVLPSPRVSDYQIDSTIRPDLTMAVTARFRVTARPTDGRVVPLNLSERLKITSATIDAEPAEIIQHDSPELHNVRVGTPFLLIAKTPLAPGKQHNVELRYEGSVIRQTPGGSYFVDDRNIWFPYSEPTLATFDLTFHCPEQLRLVSTGELISDEVVASERIVHRKTQIPQAMAGFNLGDYKATVDEQGPYRVECYANRSVAGELEDIPSQTEKVLEYYTNRWTKLPFHSIAVSPVPGYFGQGFPGLIYLSSVSYLREEDRPAPLRNSRLDVFFSELLLPHEAAHQWWGNVVVTANYRASWISEAMASDSALEFMGTARGPAAVNAVLDQYRNDLLTQDNGASIESAGPVDLGPRLLDSFGTRAWHIITYEKGAWILRMLRERLGPEAFRKLQLRLLENFASQALTNADLQQTAAAFMPPGSPDKTLSLFFDSWVYGTGIPKLTLKHTTDGLNLTLSGVADDFTADLPLHCRSANGASEIHWIRASSGENDVELRGSSACELPHPDEFLYSP